MVIFRQLLREYFAEIMPGDEYLKDPGKSEREIILITIEERKSDMQKSLESSRCLATFRKTRRPACEEGLLPLKAPETGAPHQAGQPGNRRRIYARTKSGYCAYGIF